MRPGARYTRQVSPYRLRNSLRKSSQGPAFLLISRFTKALLTCRRWPRRPSINSTPAFGRSDAIATRFSEHQEMLLLFLLGLFDLIAVGVGGNDDGLGLIRAGAAVGVSLADFDEGFFAQPGQVGARGRFQ